MNQLQGVPKKCPIAMFSLNLFQRSDLTFSHVFWNQNFEPVPSEHFKHTQQCFLHLFLPITLQYLFSTFFILLWITLHLPCSDSPRKVTTKVFSRFGSKFLFSTSSGFQLDIFYAKNLPTEHQKNFVGEKSPKR